jgi:hypothetical protein
MALDPCEELPCDPYDSWETLLRKLIVLDENGCPAFRMLGSGGGGAVAASSVSVTDAAAHFVGTNAETVFAEIGDVIRFHPNISEADAITMFIANTMTPGKWYFITLDGTSQGNAGDVIAIQALTAEVFAPCTVYYHLSDARYVYPKCVFNGSGLTLLEADMTAERISTALYNAGATTFNLTGYEVFGVHRISFVADTDLDTIQIGSNGTAYEGCEWMFFGTGGGGGNSITFTCNDNIIQDGILGNFGMSNGGNANITLRKRGINFIERHRLIS